DVVYRTATGGGAKIVDRFGSEREVKSPAEELGQRQPAAVEQGSILNYVKDCLDNGGHFNSFSALLLRRSTQRVLFSNNHYD
ncbi:MAG: hypothetical protein NTV00_11520, partial [Methylococcales bacterium]|nr:hypothetical protein [Methylococcales bacterium]